jgi:FAD/FMN-containing dehydrogenase
VQAREWDFDVIGQWSDAAESDRHIARVRRAWDGMEPLLANRGYVNHIAEDDPREKVRASYGSNHQRLRELKAKYDPANLFRLNPNISPA